MSNVEAFIEAARSLKSAKWRHLGRKTWAVDCIGVIAVSYAIIGVPFQDIKFYGREPVNGILQREARARWGEPLPADQARAGDIAVIKWRNGAPSHIGIVAEHPIYGYLTLIHANTHGVHEEALSGYLLKTVVEVYRPWV